MAAAGAAAGAALEVIGRGEDEIRAFVVKVFRLERRLRRGGLGILIHTSIFS
jgi:hypothetical protein